MNKRLKEKKLEDPKRKQVAVALHPLFFLTTSFSPGLGLNEGPSSQDGDQRMQSVGAAGE